MLSPPAAASAATTGSAVELSGLKGVKVTAVGGTTRDGARFVVPFAGTPSASRAAHVSSAGLRLAAGRRSVRLTALRVQRRSVSAALGRKRVTLFTASRAPLAGGTATLRLTAAGRATLRAGLRLRRVPTGPVGTLSVVLPAPAPAPVAGPPAPVATPVPAAVGATPTPPPASAVAVRAITAEWAFRGSWLRYLVAGGGRVETAAGATKTTDGSFAYPGSAGTYDLTAGWSLQHTGRVTFVHPSHGISIALADPVVELGPTPRVSVLLTDASQGGIPGGDASGGDGTARRVVFGTLDLSAVTPVADGETVTWPSVPVLLTAEGAAPFLAYKAGEPFGQITVRATIPPAA